MFMKLVKIHMRLHYIVLKTKQYKVHKYKSLFFFSFASATKKISSFIGYPKLKNIVKHAICHEIVKVYVMEYNY